MRLWQNTQSSEAGVYAEVILSRMEILGLYQNDMRVLSNAYFQVIDCWYTAARAKRSGAADRAFRLIKIMEVQTVRERKLSDVLSDESSESVIPDDILQKRCYPLLMKICALSNQTKDDTARSMSIAFEILDRMMCHTKPSLRLRTFRSLYACVQNYLEVHIDEERQELLQRVYEPASRYGITKGELTGWHKESQRKGVVA
jgi:hypothetical protein